MDVSKNIGKIMEDFAAQYLKEMGYKVIEQNYRIKQGEIDIICIDNETLVFVEVKYRSSDDYGRAYEYIRPQKISRIKKAAWHYIQNSKVSLPQTYRIDAVTIDGQEVSYYKNIAMG